MKTALPLLLVPLLAFGQAADAPLNPHPEGRSLHFQAGETVPFTGQCLEDTEHARREWANERTAGELAKLKESKGSAVVSVPVLVAIIAVAVAGGVAIGVGASVALKR